MGSSRMSTRGLAVERLGDLHELAVAHAERADGLVRADGPPERGQQLLGRGALRRVVDPPAADDLVAEEDVVRHREVRHQAEVLVDDGAAGGDGGLRREEGLLHVPDADAARVGHEGAGEAADERRLAGAVGTQQGVDLAAFDGQIHALEDALRAEGLGRGRRRASGVTLAPAIPRRRRSARRRAGRRASRGPGARSPRTAPSGMPFWAIQMFVRATFSASRFRLRAASALM